MTMLAELAINRAELLDGLRQLGRLVKPAKAGDAIIGFQDGQVVIAIGGGEISASASGQWPREARIMGSAILALAKHPPPDDPVLLRAFAERLTIGSMSVECAWQRSGAADIVVPIGATLMDLLRIAAEHSDESLIASGIFERIEHARAKRAEVTNRVVALLNPFGVTTRQVDVIVDDAINSGKAEGGAK